MPYFAIVLLIIFLVAALRQLIRDIEVVPFNINYSEPVKKVILKSDVTEKVTAPMIDHSTGLCIVCGMGRSQGHGWPCIVYLMKLSVAGYDKKLQKAEFILHKLLKDGNVVKEEVDKVLEEIQSARDLINGIAEESKDEGCQ